MKHKLFLFLLAFASCAAAQQPFSSSLPIVIIVTDQDPATDSPIAINDSVKIGATMQILQPNGSGVVTLADTTNADLVNYSGRIAIKTRGHTSLLSNKKSYRLETRKADDISNNNVPLMGMPKENDWILNALYNDPSYIRDALTYNLGRRTGRYAPRTHHCELFLNGVYQGIYMLSESIKVDKNRVNIKKMTADDTSGEALTGGYIFKADHPDKDEPIAWSTPSLAGDVEVTYIHHYPKPEDITQQQHDYLYGYFSHFLTAMRHRDTVSPNNYTTFIDLESFVDYMLVSELASNSDSYQYSTYFHKNRGGKICAGPLWDFNQAYGNDPKGRDGYDVWQFDNGSNTGTSFWKVLFSRPPLHDRMVNRWQQLTDNGPLALDSIMTLIDSLSTTISEAALRDKERWGHNSDFSLSIDSLKNWLTLRHSWLDNQLRSNNIIAPLSSADGCSVSFYPNPTRDLLHIELSEEAASKGYTIVVVNPVGTKVMSLTNLKNSLTIDLSQLPSGVYTMRLTTADGPQSIHKIIKID